MNIRHAPRDDGSVYVLDNQLCHVVVISAEGEHLQSISREGDGADGDSHTNRPPGPRDERGHVLPGGRQPDGGGPGYRDRLWRSAGRRWNRARTARGHLLRDEVDPDA